MKVLKNLITISCLLMFILGYQNVDAQQNIEQETSDIFENSCNRCHGEGGSYTEHLILQYPVVIKDGSVIPGDPDNSEFYKRLIETDVLKRMPFGQPPLSSEAIQTIRQWILAGAPDWNLGPPDRSFITTDTILDSIETHLDTLAAFDRPYARYFSLTHLYNAGKPAETLIDYRNALSKLVNSLSWGRNVTNPEPIDPEETIFYIDLRRYEWESGTNRWTQIEEAYPYSIELCNVETETGLLRKLTNLREAMDCNVPFVHVDWFLATASLPPLYNDILGLPETDRALEAELDVDVAANLQTAPGIRVWRAGFNNSGVSRNNRVIERHTSRYGAYWKSYDFAGSVGTQNVFSYPLNFTHDGGEIIFNLPNGFQAYYLIDATGNRLDVAPTTIVSNPAASDPAVRNGLSCIGCHTVGMKQDFEDEVRAVIEANANPPYDKAHALRLYVEKSVMDARVSEDAERYKNALEASGGDIKDIEPVHRFYEAFQGPVDTAHAAAAVGLEIGVFLDKIDKNTLLQSLGLLQLVGENGRMQRDAWTAGFPEVVSALYDDIPLVEPDDRDDPISGVVFYL